MESEIKDTLALVESIKAELEVEKNKFVEVCKIFAKNEINERIRSAISSNSQKVKELGAEGLAPIKSKVEESLSTIDSFVESIFCTDSIWLHRQKELTSENCPFGSYTVHGNRLPDIVEEPLRMLLSPAGEIIMSNDLDTSDNWEKKGSMMRYRYGFSYSKELKDSMASIGDKFDELYRLLEKLDDLKARKESNEALNLWDKI